MATQKSPTAKKAPKIPLPDMLNALDKRDKTWYSTLDDDQKKDFSPWLVMRYASSVDGPAYVQEHYLTATNQLCNRNFSGIGKEHDELHWLCIQAVGVGAKQMHPFLKPPKKGKKNRLFEWLIEKYPSLSDDEIELMISINSPDDFKMMAEQLSMQPSEIDAIFTK